METEIERPIVKRLLARTRYFNREYFNPFFMSFVGRPNSFWSAVRHVGRRSGVEYTTPVIAMRQNDSFVISLPYGQQVDWFKNVMAAGGCTLIYRGKVYAASEPEIIPPQEGLRIFPSLIQAGLRMSDTESFLRLNRSWEAPDGETQYRAFTAAYPLDRGLWILAALGAFAIGIGVLAARRRGGSGGFCGLGK